ncbi:hypothetical protein RXV86_14980 [Alisedimentitalea sp. MJ-SS2]|uniref:hypothetical protein n=1 Tax=Aliisedimentitalea sp. MJ-SS2 TaxID=3049795 RepID=UPI002909BEFB|nr:hypothetical protein [Alisedimentitalea sp. MJ-SS2]MDU8928693.1 hypothetical protein [Alisedimentitalea sp. MJ-SS2]
MFGLIRFLDYFGGFAILTGLLWLYTLYRRVAEATEVPMSSFDQPLAAASIFLIGIAMIIAARIVAAHVRMRAKQVDKTRA